MYDNDDDGCASLEKRSKHQSLHILFANDSSEIPPLFIKQINKMSEFLKAYQSTSIEIKGYASKVGAKEHNFQLSMQRSQAVKSLLISDGITPDRIKIVAFGEAELASKQNSKLAHALNRRVTATVIGYKNSPVEEWHIFTALPE